MTPPIAINFDSVGKSIGVLRSGKAELPTAGEVQRHEGIDIGVTAPFMGSVEYCSNVLSALVESMHRELAASEEAIRLTVEDLVRNDASAADEAKTLLTAIDAITAVEPSTPTAPAKPAAPRSW